MRDPLTYRYHLSRSLPWNLFSKGTVLFVMLNPSTADEFLDDPTIRRCIGFAKSWGYSYLLVGNLFGMRATDPRELGAAIERDGWAAAVGPDNDKTVLDLAGQASLVVCAWGASEHAASRSYQLVEQLQAAAPGGLFCASKTQDGHPSHPLYLPSGVNPTPWEPARW